MNTYEYFDTSQSVWIYPGWYNKQPSDLHVKHGYHKSPVIFECVAEDILEADKLFEESLNTCKILLVGEKKKPKTYDVSKMPHIVLKIEKIF